MAQFWKRVWLAIPIAILSGIGVWVLLSGTQADSQSAGETLSTLQTIHDRIKSRFYKPEKTDSKELYNGAIRGMLERLEDPYTRYLPTDDYQKFLKDFEKSVINEFGGIGVQIEVQDGVLKVVSPLRGGPAIKVGVRAGDWIKAIEGQPTLGITQEEAVRKLRGEKGTSVTIGVQHEDGTDETITIIREIIQIRVVTYELMDGGQIAYLQVNSFNEQTRAEVDKALNELMKPGNQIKAFVLDLRNNPGGLLTAAQELASLFIDKGTILRSESRDGPDALSSLGNKLPNLPLAVLINRGSASASEIVSGAIRDHQMGILVGRTSFGKGVIQSTFPIEGGALIMTTAEYFTPNHHKVQGVGLVPDIWVEHEEDVLRTALDWLRSQYGKTCPCQAPKSHDSAQVRPPMFYSWFTP
jgi:carboxyl-terminal processing protease